MLSSFQDDTVSLFFSKSRVSSGKRSVQRLVECDFCQAFNITRYQLTTTSNWFLRLHFVSFNRLHEEFKISFYNDSLLYSRSLYHISDIISSCVYNGKVNSFFWILPRRRCRRDQFCGAPPTPARMILRHALNCHKNSCCESKAVDIVDSSVISGASMAELAMGPFS